MAGAVVYKWIDGQGKLQYGDRPPDGVHAEVVELLGVHTARTVSTRTPDSSQSPRVAQGTPEETSAKKAVDSDVEQSRDKQCAEAQDHYKKLIDGRRLYKTGADGERQYLTSQEIDSERINAKREVDATCNSST
jgi:hypothetical protein